MPSPQTGPTVGGTGVLSLVVVVSVVAVGTGVGAAVGAVALVGIALGTAAYYITQDLTLYTEHMLIPEAALSSTMGQVFGDQIPWKNDQHKDEEFCDFLIDMR